MLVVALAGLVLPITLILAAVLVDVCVLLWAAYRIWHDRMAPRLHAFTHDFLLGTVARHSALHRPT